MERNRIQYLIGIGGWEHDVLDQCFYPRPGMTSADKLAYYAGFFGVTEVRATFWDDELSATDAREWVDAVRGVGEFQFNVKLHRAFTHQREIRPAMTKTVRGILQELARANRLGSLLLQFPYGFTNTGNSRHHLEKLADLFRGFPLYVELRHYSWYSPSLLNFLAENALHPVGADLPHVRQYMPYITGVVGDTAYLRLHGRNEKGWVLNGIDARYDYLYNSKEVAELRRRISALTDRCRRVMVVCNNTTGGKAVANALQFSSALRETDRFFVPDAAYKTFPGVRELGTPRQQQESLFDQPGLRTAI